ncbi:sterol desaturase [Geomonas silvestris]|uniref:Sterol desaturase n=1 Tax=Geomonas silvestris TaxID=2740184 RepID=A0A6V8MPN6_9BACT|nr:sterol desaturase family protein [Geomonas silvestris]GFO61579.1 sterol desaturase [Geomonas silvestris]
MGSRSRTLSGELPSWLSKLLIVGTITAVALAELRRPLRVPRQSKLNRDRRNLVVALLAAGTVALAERPVVGPLARRVQRHNLGLLKLVRLPVTLEVLLAVLLLDYTLYIWHYLTHKVPFLWRFHLAHHVDLDLDASTALRFHPGELLLSVPWRAAQVRLLGIAPFSLALWQTLTLLEILFHHSNLRLPLGLERRLCRIIVTPRMHGIHHSIVRRETESNWSTILSWPDYLHGTLRLNVPQQAVTIGVASYQNAAELTLGKILLLPFQKMRSTRAPLRGPLAIPRNTLAG